MHAARSHSSSSSSSDLGGTAADLHCPNMASDWPALPTVTLLVGWMVLLTTAPRTCVNRQRCLVRTAKPNRQRVHVCVCVSACVHACIRVCVFNSTLPLFKTDQTAMLISCSNNCCRCGALLSETSTDQEGKIMWKKKKKKTRLVQQEQKSLHSASDVAESAWLPDHPAMMWK